MMENGTCRLRPNVRQILRELDHRGILLSIASANDEDLALTQLRRKGIDHLFLHPQICWGNKVSSIARIARMLNLSPNSVAFIDDEPYELEQVHHLLPGVRVYHARDYGTLLRRPEFDPPFLTKESCRRRKMVIQGNRRDREQAKLTKSHRDFLMSCRTRMTVRRARKSDLPRILELMERTHQLNATGILYSSEEIQSFLGHPDFRIYVAQLRDRFVDYGRIGAALCRCHPGRWEILSFLLSCRVLTRGIGHSFLSWLQCESHRNGALVLECHYKKQERNHRMYLLYRLSGFESEEGETPGSFIFRKRVSRLFNVPEWLTLVEEDGNPKP
jgi:FkbH-like protein